MNDLEKWFVLKQVGQMDSLKAAARILERIRHVLQRAFWKKALQGSLLPCLLMQLEGEKVSLCWPAEALVLGLWGNSTLCGLPAPGALVLLDCLRELVGMISAPGHTKNTHLSCFQTCHSSVDMPVVYSTDIPALIKPAACLNGMISVLE